MLGYLVCHQSLDNRLQYIQCVLQLYTGTTALSISQYTQHAMGRIIGITLFSSLQLKFIMKMNRCILTYRVDGSIVQSGWIGPL